MSYRTNNGYINNGPRTKLSLGSIQDLFLQVNLKFVQLSTFVSKHKAKPT